jgi:GcrA cell cycle regulator
MSWTDERVETLKRMWAEGASASQIAKELGQVTRNAVIGKVHRLGLSNRVAPGGRPEDADELVEEAPVAEAAGQPAQSEPAAEPEPEPEPDEEAEVAAAPEPEEEEEDDEETAPVPFRRPIIPAGQPLPPQPSANEISPEAQAAALAVEQTAAKRLSLMELTEKTCKWPVGDPATPNFWFCGLPVQQGKPYCEAHVGVAFQPMSARRDRRR